MVSKGDWVRTRHKGYNVTKLVLAVKPNGIVVLGEHEQDSDTITREPGRVEKVNGTGL
jgi:hypothetical protein